jgi:hypothetical protein
VNGADGTWEMCCSSREINLVEIHCVTKLFEFDHSNNVVDGIQMRIDFLDCDLKQRKMRG